MTGACVYNVTYSLPGRSCRGACSRRPARRTAARRGSRCTGCRSTCRTAGTAPLSSYECRRVAEDHVGRLISERSMQLRGNKPCRSWKRRRVNGTYSCSGPTRTCGCTPAACSARESSKKSTVNRGSGARLLGNDVLRTCAYDEHDERLKATPSVYII